MNAGFLLNSYKIELIQRDENAAGGGLR